ncbi:hypothetical protein L21SP2_2787 [Salinispira pacifica]|uniref:Uncharacterized protein n=1 Tax=Salinispira pacifica TaxID=1307761 RepID=V5WK06_9SPIO|nr:hypothetical protein L21SP2_2787 [Salinispira pacifica]
MRKNEEKSPGFGPGRLKRRQVSATLGEIILSGGVYMLKIYQTHISRTHDNESFSGISE